MCIKVILWAVTAVLSLLGTEVAIHYDLVPYVATLGREGFAPPPQPRMPTWPSAEDFKTLHEAAESFNYTTLPPPDLFIKHFFPPNRSGCPPPDRHETPRYNQSQEQPSDRPLRQLFVDFLYSLLLCELRFYSWFERIAWASIVGFRCLDDRKAKPRAQDIRQEVDWPQFEEYKSLKDENDELKANNAILFSIYGINRTNAQDLETKLSKYQFYLQDLETQLCDQQIADLAAMNTKHLAELDDLQKFLSSKHNEELASKQNEIDNVATLHFDSIKVEEQLEVEKTRVESLLGAKEQALKSQAGLLEQSKKDLRQAQEQLGELRGNAQTVKQLEKDKADLSSSLEEMKKDSKSQALLLDHTESDLAHAQKELVKTRHDSKKVKQLEKEKADLESRLDSTERASISDTDLLHQAETKLAQAQYELTGLCDHLSKTEVRRNEIERRERVFKSEIDRLKAKNEEASRTHEAIVKDLEKGSGANHAEAERLRLELEELHEKGICKDPIAPSEPGAESDSGLSPPEHQKAPEHQESPVKSKLNPESKPFECGAISNLTPSTVFTAQPAHDQLSKNIQDPQQTHPLSARLPQQKSQPSVPQSPHPVSQLPPPPQHKRSAPQLPAHLQEVVLQSSASQSSHQMPQLPPPSQRQKKQAPQLPAHLQEVASTPSAPQPSPQVPLPPQQQKRHAPQLPAHLQGLVPQSPPSQPPHQISQLPPPPQPQQPKAPQAPSSQTLPHQPDTRLPPRPPVSQVPQSLSPHLLQHPNLHYQSPNLQLPFGQQPDRRHHPPPFSFGQPQTPPQLQPQNMPYGQLPQQQPQSFKPYRTPRVMTDRGTPPAGKTEPGSGFLRKEW